jgi:hypothetical protein
MIFRSAALVLCLVLALASGGQTGAAFNLGGAPAGQATGPAAQEIDEAYTALIAKHLQDPRISTDLVDHLPSSDTVPSPLEFLGRAVGTPGELTYARDIHRYYETLAASSSRAKFWRIGTTEEGRDIVVLAIADEATIQSIERYKSALDRLTDPRRTTDEEAQRFIADGKPIYYIVAGMHSPETGGPEMLIELAYRLIVEETPFIQAIRNNVITLITPVLEVDGREKQVDTYYFNKTRAPGEPRLPLMYWGKYVQHDNNRDGIGQFLELTRAVTRVTLEWHPTITHDLHEAQTYLYTSTGTGPYNEALDPITVSEWWMLAQNDVMEMAKRGVPGVWTYGFYDGWVPNYMIFIAHSHNAVGRFYEVQGYGPDPTEVRPPPSVLSREWFRTNPPLPHIKWGPRNNTNIQQSAVLLSLNHVAKNRQLYLENYWLKNKRAVAKGKDGPLHGWVIPAAQRRKADAAALVNDLRRQGLEISRATASFSAGAVHVDAGDYIVRGDQPFRTIADMYFSVQNYPPQNPTPYDDTGWTMPLMRDVRVVPVTDKGLLAQPMTLVTADVKARGGIEGAASGSVLVVEHTGDNALASFRFRNAGVKMFAAESDFEIDGGAPRLLRAGSMLIPNADRRTLVPQLEALGLSGWLIPSLPDVKTHELDVPRIGYVHTWTRTQDEGWWRAALDTYGIPYTYLADQKLREGNLRSRFDVLLFPHVGGSAVSQVNGIARTGTRPLPYRKTDATPHLGFLDSSEDIRGGMGLEGLAELVKFVQQGGTLITEGSTARILPEYGITSGISVEEPSQLFVRGSILRGKIADAGSPIVYGYAGSDLPVYFNQAPVLNAGGPGGAPAEVLRPAPIPGVGQNITPNAAPLRLSTYDTAPGAHPGQSQPEGAPAAAAERPRSEDIAQLRDQSGAAEAMRPRVVMRFPAEMADMLLSGTLANGQALANRAAIVDAKIGDGHVVMFAIRPFWRWQTHGTYGLGFNAMMNWNDLDAGR